MLTRPHQNHKLGVLVFSLLMALATILSLTINPTPKADRCGTYLKVALVLLLIVWLSLSTLLILHLTKLISQNSKSMLALFSLYTVFTLYVCQLQVYGTNLAGSDSECKSIQPGQWYWLLINVVLFYVVIVAGLIVWGPNAWSGKEERI